MAETIGKYYIMKQQNTSWKLLCFKLMIKSNNTISAFYGWNHWEVLNYETTEHLMEATMF